MILKLIALGLKRYLRSRWNVFDGLVVMISMVDLLVELVTKKDNSSLSILRSFRLVRNLSCYLNMDLLTDLFTGLFVIAFE